MPGSSLPGLRQIRRECGILLDRSVNVKRTFARFVAGLQSIGGA